jgi:excisionase family DNA binding protein
MATSTRAAPRATAGWLTIEEAAEYTRFAYSTIKALIASGQLKAYYPTGSRSVRIRVDDVDAFMTGERR